LFPFGYGLSYAQFRYGLYADMLIACLQNHYLDRNNRLHVRILRLFLGEERLAWHLRRKLYNRVHLLADVTRLQFEKARDAASMLGNDEVNRRLSEAWLTAHRALYKFRTWTRRRIFMPSVTKSEAEAIRRPDAGFDTLMRDDQAEVCISKNAKALLHQQLAKIRPGSELDTRQKVWTIRMPSFRAKSILRPGAQPNRITLSRVGASPRYGHFLPGQTAEKPGNAGQLGDRKHKLRTRKRSLAWTFPRHGVDGARFLQKSDFSLAEKNCQSKLWSHRLSSGHI
jgi:hypothetical protein